LTKLFDFTKGILPLAQELIRLQTASTDYKISSMKYQNEHQKQRERERTQEKERQRKRENE